jgi:hypothetical protein
MSAPVIAVCDGCDAIIHEDDEYALDEVRIGGEVEDRYHWCAECVAGADEARRQMEGG